MRLNIKNRVLQTGVFVTALAMLACGTSGPSKDKKESADIHLQLGVRYLDMNKLSFAKEHLEKALEIDSDHTEALNALAFLYEKLKQPEEAEELYEDAIDTAPEDFGVQNNFGRFLCEQGKYERGLGYLKQAASAPLNSRQWLALTNAGRCELTQNHTDTAEAYFRQALQLQPFYSPALLEMQKLSYQKGEYWDAKGFLGRYLSVGKHTSETLWYAYQTERALGNRFAAENYRKMLLDIFPLSKEAKQIRSVRKNLTNGK
ncbi:MAG: type IV pilus biogenesis/stability protein PilW [Gammaproteobacteria bacterium]